MPAIGMLPLASILTAPMPAPRCGLNGELIEKSYSTLVITAVLLMLPLIGVLNPPALMLLSPLRR